MNVKTKFLEEYVNFVDSTKKQNKYFQVIINLFVIILCFFLFFVLFIYKSKKYSYNCKNTNIRIQVNIQY